MILQKYPSTKLIKSIYKNILGFVLYQVAAKTPVFPRSDVIEWITRRIDHERRTILKFKGKNVDSYEAQILNQIYHFKESQVKVTLEWLQSKYDSIDFLTIMK